MDIVSLIQSFADWEFLHGEPAAFLVCASMALIAVALNRRISLVLLLFTYLGFGYLSLETLPAHWAFSKLVVGVGVVLIGWHNASPHSKFAAFMHIWKRVVFAFGVTATVWVLYWFDVWSIVGLPREWNLAILSSLGLGIWLFMFLSEPLHRLLGFLFLLLGVDLLLSYSGSASGVLFVSAAFQLLSMLLMPLLYKQLLRPLRTA